nr:CBASS cGAMP synthase [Brevundimonas diminuta]
MRYNATKLFYQPHGEPCLRAALALTDQEHAKLMAAQKIIRDGLRSGLAAVSEFITSEEAHRLGVPESARRLGFAPKFRTQGSMAYGTLNRPAKAGQQIDLDDGMYVPMSMVQGVGPGIASHALFNICERILAIVCRQNAWSLDTSKSICIRVELDAGSHIDMNIYAVPDVQLSLVERSMNVAFAQDSRSEPVRLDPDEIYVAHRETGWEQSDPLELEDWYVAAAHRHSGWTDLRRITRYLKAWRDQRWDACSLSSIVLMVCAVEALDEANTPPIKGRDDDGLLVVARALPGKIAGRIANPVVDDKSLNDHWTLSDRNAFELGARALRDELDNSLNNESSCGGVVARIRKLFGARVPDNAALVTPIAVMSQIRDTPAQRNASPKVGSQTSG